MKVINIFGGPGIGKSTTAAGLFTKMKLAGYRVELVTEYAKDLTYEAAHSVLGNQLAILGEQDRRLRRLNGKVDYVITDSPLLIGLVYVVQPYNEPWFTNAVTGAFNSYENINVVLHRVKPYQLYGRNHTESQAIEIDRKIEGILAEYPKTIVYGNEVAPESILLSLRMSKGA